MKKNLLAIFSIGVIVSLFSIFTFAQEKSKISPNASKYVISAEAGGVNYIQGKVAISKKTGKSGLLLKGDKVRIGDKILTEADGKVEILLNPGSYLRLGENSSFEFLDTSLENLQIKLDRGSAMFEVITTDDFKFVVNTPKATFNVIKSGVYRIDVLNDGTGKIEVRKGRAQIGEDEKATVKKGKAATVIGDNVAIAKFDRDDRDALEEWSRGRAKDLAKINDRLERRNLRNTLITGFNNRNWNLYDSFGLWVYDPLSSGYCFLPFGYGWSSPYGFGLRRDIWSYGLPSYIYIQPPPRMINNMPSNNSRNSANNTTNSPRNTPPAARVSPPFRTVDRSIGRGSVRDGGFDGIEPGNKFPGRSTPRAVNPASRVSAPNSEIRMPRGGGKMEKPID